MEEFYSKILGIGLLFLGGFFVYYFRAQYNKNPNNYNTLSIAQGAGLVIITFALGMILLLGIINSNKVKVNPKGSNHNITQSTAMDSPQHLQA